MGFVKFYRTRLSPIVTITALVIGIHIAWWSIQQKLVEKRTSKSIVASLFFSSPALVPPTERRRNLLGLRVPYLSPPVADKEKKSE